jgi:hypothetical protein
VEGLTFGAAEAEAEAIGGVGTVSTGGAIVADGAGTFAELAAESAATGCVAAVLFDSEGESTT